MTHPKQENVKGCGFPPELNKLEEVRAFLLSIKDYSFEQQIIAVVRFIGTEREDAAAKITQRFPWLGGDK